MRKEHFITKPQIIEIIEHYGGLHCGECFEVFVSGQWQPVRIEKYDDWYLVGLKTELQGLRVRI